MECGQAGNSLAFLSLGRRKFDWFRDYVAGHVFVLFGVEQER
jgi:hypothetical protein